ncbi:MAG: hypothetical protein KGR46_03360 [Verrucomicrobia bacterium]|nr:hypothetical protein [Verrucomicrobiota bacterium]
MMPSTYIDAINHAAAQSDRWMFVALILIGLLAVFSLFRYFTSRLDRIKLQMDAQTTEFVTHLKTANREMLTVIASAQEVINRNSQIMERVERKLEGR